MVYLSVFALSAGCFAASESRKLHRDGIRRILIGIGILLPAILAGLRAPSVGTDVETYAARAYWEASDHAGLIEYLAFCQEGQYEGSLLFDQLFWCVVFLCSRICPDYHFGLFIYNLLAVVFWYLGLRRCCRLYSLNRKSIAFGMLVFYLFLYNASLSYMRMSIAVALVFYALTFLFEKKYLYYGMISVIAIFFHSTAFLSFAFLVLYLLMRRRKKYDTLKKDVFKLCLFLMIMVLMILYIEPVITFLVEQGLLRENYLGYFVGGKYLRYEDSSIAYLKAGLKLGLSQKSFRLMCIYFIASILFYPYMRNRADSSLFFPSVAIISCLVAACSGITGDLYRVCYYCIPWIYVDFLIVGNQLAENKKKKTCFIMALICVILALLWWNYYFVERGHCETVPYEFYSYFIEDFRKWTER